MFNPRKEKPKFLPYWQPVPPFYPSQSMDFIPLHLGGLNMPQYPPPFRGRGANGASSSGLAYQTGPGFQQRHTRQQNTKNYSGGRGNYNRRPPQPYNRGGFQGRFQHHPQPNNVRQYTQPKIHQVKKNENRDIFKEYFHKSMLEDPWKELLERHEALTSSSFEN